MKAVGAEFIVAGNKPPFVDRRTGGLDHATLAMWSCPHQWPVSVLQTVNISQGHLLSLAIFLHEHNPVEAILMFSSEHLRVINAVELLHLTVLDGNCLLAIL
jgi:hypothetical protein